MNMIDNKQGIYMRQSYFLLLNGIFALCVFIKLMMSFQVIKVFTNFFLLVTQTYVCFLLMFHCTKSTVAVPQYSDGIGW